MVNRPFRAGGLGECRYHRERNGRYGRYGSGRSPTVYYAPAS